MDRHKLIPVLLVVAGLVAYHNSLTGPFIFDDFDAIADNPHVRQLWPLTEAMSAPPDSGVAGRPVVCLSLAINYVLGGLDVRGYHAFNLVIHILNTLLLYGIVRRTLKYVRQVPGASGSSHQREEVEAPLPSLTASPPPHVGGYLGSTGLAAAAVVALVWTVHPLLTESVTYVVQRTELLMALFLLLTLYCVIRGWQVGAVVACALGMGSKEVMVVAPILVFLYDRIFMPGSWRDRRRLYAGLAATWVILPVWVAASSFRAKSGFGMELLTPWSYALTQCGVILHYLRLCFWPAPLVIDYDDWRIGAQPVAVVLILGLLGVTVWALRHRPKLGFLGAWFFLILAPTSSFLPLASEIAAERRMYLPLAAVVTVVVVMAQRFAPPVKIGLVAAITAALMVGTVRRNADYRNEIAIWSDTVAKRPNNARAHNNLGHALFSEGKLIEASARFAEAVRLKPGYADAYNNLGTVLQASGKLEQAAGAYREALRREPDLPGPYNNLGAMLFAQGNVAGAITHYEHAVRLNPNFAEARYNLALALVQAGKPDQALPHLELAGRLRPDDPDVRRELERWRNSPHGNR